MTSTTSKRSKSKPKSTKRAPSPPTPFNIKYSNIRGLRTNFTDVESLLHSTKPSVLCLCETNLDSSISERDFDVPGYSTLITKHDHLRRHMHGLGIYIKTGTPCARVPSFEDPDQPYICLRVALIHVTSYIFFLYRPQDDNLAVINSIAAKKDLILCDNPSATFHICGDFNVHHEEWLTFSNKTTAEGIDCQNFALAHDLTQVVTFPTRIPDVESHFSSLLDLFLTNSHDLSEVSFNPPLGTSLCG